MISQTKTYHTIPVRKRPEWVASEPEDAGLTAFASLVGGMIGALVGLFIALAADAAYINGPGLGDGNDGTFAQCAPYIFTPSLLAVIAGIMMLQVLPRYYARATYFTNTYHQAAYEQFKELDKGHQELARDAYHALAAFDSPERRAPEYDLLLEANKTWDATYQKLRARQDAGSIEEHKSRISAAKNTLEIL